MNPLIRSFILNLQSAFNDYPASAYGEEHEFSQEGLHPVFIVGAPRTGSTLLYQLMVKHLKVSYISNAMALLPRHMLSIAQWTRHWMNNIEDIRRAHVGYVPGLFRPNEAGAIMRKWFDEGKPRDRMCIRNTVILLSEVLDGPFVNKNLLNSLRLNSIYTVFPEARFIHITRNPLYTAQSIVLTRRSRGTDWLGPRPHGYEGTLGSSPLYQAIWQVKRIEETVAEFLLRCLPDHIGIAYEEVCRDPKGTLMLVADCLNAPFKSGSDTNSLTVRDTNRLPESEWNELLEYYRAIYGREGPCLG
jgi:LPS sulfotransferase NodH